MSNKELLDNIKKLRELTGVGFKDCKLALDESKGNIEKSKAIDLPKNKSMSLIKILKKIFPNHKDWENEKTGHPSVMMISDNKELIKIAQPLIDNKRITLVKDPNKLYLRERRDIDKLIITEMEKMSWSDETSIMQKFDVQGRKKKLVTYWLYYPVEDEQ